MSEVYATGVMPIKSPTITLKFPDLPEGIEGPFHLFEHGGEGDVSGGMNDYKGHFYKFEEAMKSRTQDNAQIAVQSYGEMKVVAIYMQDQWMSSFGARVTGWQLVIE